ncbi:MAG: hypothetical protein EZS28_018168 [Streblomastix strix]|uniref:Uncharacterized protein n=1 Tax=Streblomastix strix TaxID=222440 RepID=A0A5J4VVW0_9EUKA|nr:MAG: hypothetical protein EZS28_018168 [Streblomastix strix]
MASQIDLLGWLNLSVTILFLVVAVFTYWWSTNTIKIARRIQSMDIAYRESRIVRRAAWVTLILFTFQILFLWHDVPQDKIKFFEGKNWFFVIATVLGGLGAIILVLGLISGYPEVFVPRQSHAPNTGFYDRIRHPVVTGLILLWTSIALARGSLAVSILVGVILISFLFLVQNEDENQELRYGLKYALYKAAVPAFYPVLKENWNVREQTRLIAVKHNEIVALEKTSRDFINLETLGTDEAIQWSGTLRKHAKSQGKKPQEVKKKDDKPEEKKKDEKTKDKGKKKQGAEEDPSNQPRHNKVDLKDQ